MRKRNKILIILGALFAITAIAFLILGFALGGADVLAWFGSKYAMLFYIAFGTYAIAILSILIGDWIKGI